MNDPWSRLAVLRLCGVCGQWRGYAMFRGLAKTCMGCLRDGTRGISRSIVITSKGRSDLAIWRAEEAAVA